MNPNESWLAEQARLLMQEDGFGPGYNSESGGSSNSSSQPSGDSSSSA
jgi:hypothetical protein